MIAVSPTAWVEQTLAGPDTYACDSDVFLPPRTRRAIRRSARAIAARSRWQSFRDASDLEQDASVAVLRAIPRYDASRGSEDAFVGGVLGIWVRDTRRRLARGRRQYEHLSLDALVSDGLEFASNGPAEGATYTARDLRFDLAALISTLPSDQANLACLLMQLSPSEAAERLGVHRGTVYRQINSLRKRFADSGFAPKLRSTHRHQDTGHGGSPS
jgi:RNA polymerase sigma factor (sigma-70 family)